jgi:hypothetical protein
MGTFYVNFSVKSSEPQQIAAVLRQAGRKAIVTASQAGYVVVYDEEAENQSLQTILQVGSLLSQSLNTIVMAVLNHDDRILRYWLFKSGAVVDAYDSRPDYFKKFFAGLNEDEADDEMKSTDSAQVSNPQQLQLQIKPKADLPKIKKILKTKYPTETDRHRAFVQALGLPDWAIGFGYDNARKLESSLELKDQKFIVIA